MNATWQALAREAGLAAEHIASGVTALGRANYAQHAYYAEAFFALSIGIERAGKLGLVVDHALDHGGAFPTSKAVRDYCHDIERLLALMDGIATKRGASETCPSSPIHEGIIETLAEFATNITRYYNLQLVTGDPRAATRDDPIAAWYQRVTKPILEAHYPDRLREKHEQNARAVEALIGDFTLARHHAETGEAIDSVYEGSVRTGANEFAKPWERMYVLQIARFIGSVFSELAHATQVQQLSDVPYFPDFFAIFSNDDAYFRSRKTWSIYRP